MKLKRSLCAYHYRDKLQLFHILSKCILQFVYPICQEEEFFLFFILRMANIAKSIKFQLNSNIFCHLFISAFDIDICR